MPKNLIICQFGYLYNGSPTTAKTTTKKGVSRNHVAASLSKDFLSN